MTQSKPLAVVAAVLIATFSSFPYANGAGRSTTAVVNTILNGKGAPKSSLGIDGDFYIDVRSLLIYGPKIKGKWPTPQNIQGPTGPSGSDGKNGADGKAISTANVNTVVGPQGPQGPTGPTGPQGEKGEAGLPGATGPAGPAGSAGASGPAGANGSTGAQGPAGATGAAGATGPAGAKGETGTVGPSEVTVIDVPSITLGTSVAYSYAVSQSIGNLLANQSYKFEMYLRGTSSLIDLVLGVDVVSSGNTLNFSYIRSDFRYSTYSNVQASYGFVISGTVRIGAADSSLVVRIIDGRGETGSTALVVSGKAYITLVGAIK